MLDIALLRGTKGRILGLLRRGERTADELAGRLEVTPNAVRAHLTELERDGLVRQRTVRRGPRKPSFGFSLTEQGDALFPKQYGALLNAVLDDVRTSHGASNLEALFRRLGRRLATTQAARFSGLSPQARLVEAQRALTELGGLADLVADPSAKDSFVVEGQSCPLKAVVPEHAEACVVLQTFLETVLPGARVREACQKQGTPHCCFEVTLAPSVA